MNYENNKLNDKLNTEKYNCKQLSEELNKYKNLNMILNNEVNDLKITINNQIMEIEKLKKEKVDLNNELNKINNQKKNLNNEILNLNDQIKDLKMNKNSNLSFINPAETLFCIQFRSIDEIVDLAIPCKNTDIFVRLEEKLYEYYPEYKETNNYFTCNGIVIKKFKSLKENKIKNSDKILMNIE